MRSVCTANPKPAMNFHGIFSVALMCLFLMSCASQTMKQYMGKDIKEVYFEHGQPANEFFLEDGKRVYQFYWGESSSGSALGRKGGCLLSYITQYDGERDRWIVVDYKYPDRLIC